MIPGTITKISEESMALAATIYPKSDLIHVTDTTSTTNIATIVAPYTGSSGIMFIVNRSGNPIATVTTGNIRAARTIPSDLTVMLVYSKSLEQYIVGAIS